MSTHYDRMIHEDDRTIMFANRGRRRVPRLRPHRRIEVTALYTKDGEKYFVVDTHMHYWNPAPDNWVPGAEQYAKGWIECFHAYQGWGRRRPTGRSRSS
jgi:hypothetical protein